MWMPRWLGEIYSKLYAKFWIDVFTFNQAREYSGIEKSILNVAFSKLHSLRALYIHSRTKPRLYRLIRPESFVLMCSNVIKNINAIRQERYLQLICDVAKELIRGYSDCSICIYGSVARGVARPESDLDILVVSDSFKGPKTKRVEELCLIEERVADEIKRLRSYGIYTSLSFYPLRRDEVLRFPPVMLDIVVDGIVICDNGFLEKAMPIMREKMNRLGAKRVVLKDGSWYWDLKPDYRFGEVVEL
ncbi:MAG: nucleotidyltransferase domain-containing protein [Candidatus Nezhaarchaeales archaeon]